MIPSALDKRITIEKETTIKNAVGTPIESYVFLKEAYANKIPSGGNMQYNAVGETPFTLDVFQIRYDERVDYKCRVIYNNNYYKIEHIELQGRRHWMKLKVVVWDRATNF